MEDSDASFFFGGLRIVFERHKENRKHLFIRLEKEREKDFDLFVKNTNMIRFIIRSKNSENFYGQKMCCFRSRDSIETGRLEKKRVRALHDVHDIWSWRWSSRANKNNFDSLCAANLRADILHKKRSTHETQYQKYTEIHYDIMSLKRKLRSWE